MPRTLADLAHLTSPSSLILVSLAGGPKHGYAIMNDIEAITRQRFGPGTIYTALRRLERLGLVEALPVQERRLTYRLTPVGQIALRLHLQGVRRVSQLGLQRLAELKGGGNL